MDSTQPCVRPSGGEIVKAQRYVPPHVVGVELAAVGFRRATLAVHEATPDPIVATRPRPADELSR